MSWLDSLLVCYRVLTNHPTSLLTHINKHALSYSLLAVGHLTNRRQSCIVLCVAQLGNLLREAREAKGLSPQEIFNATKIRANVLVALEAEDFDNLPAPVYVRGLLRTLSKPLALDAAELLALYEVCVPDGHAASVLPMRAIVPVVPPQHLPQHREPQQEPNLAVVLAKRNEACDGKPKSITISITIPLGLPNFRLPKVAAPHVSIPQIEMPRVALPKDWLASHKVWQGMRRYRLNVNMLLSAAFVLSLLFGAGWGGSLLMKNISEVRSISAAQIDPTPTLSFALNPTIVAPLTRTPAPTRPPPTATPLPRAVSLDVKIDLVTRSWMRVEVDGAEAYEGILEAGTSKTFSAKSRITMRAGNAGGLKITVNDQSEGALGGNGEVVERQWQLTENGTVGITPPTWTNNPGPIVAPARKP